MSRFYWRSVFAVGGLILLAGVANAQPIGDDPGTGERPAQTQSKPQSDANPRARKAIQDGVEGISSTLETYIDTPDPTAEQERARRDLKAQEDMAKWAMGMFWAAVATAILTAAGVALIWRTLIYTRTAADHAGETVKEARQATKAAQDGVLEARNATKEAERSADIQEAAFRRLERPYVFVFGVSKLIWIGEKRPSVSFSVGNYGKSPAIIEEVFAGFDVAFEPEVPLAVEESHPLRVHPVLAAGDTQSDITEQVPDWINFTLHGVPLMEAGRDFFFRIVIHYRGPFTSGHETSACWHYDRHEGVLTGFGGDDYNYIDKKS